ncbi:uncharacterized protein BO72DRAFT_497866 [Aspergillus fijiensis CBS 313.89]|uniref:Uncharacterized protein n=1 Tax=Aspergillus fijiensis CBS 313.89 TaxID=1448319 RepID=A0A8G1RKC1_9EURO|nr:uncharacterized protein BO72DRAFT_497866 [Aspergillus fijiensis CBS 313.89]RAK75592.1 hypothetical protein BO72DRAFT_497866 [Aspergillus fijiensis CBS 313.89]
MASRKFPYRQQVFAACSQPDLGQTDDHELHNLDDLASSQPIPLLELCLKQSSRNKGARAQRQYMLESAAGVSTRVVSSGDKDLASSRFSTLRGSINNAFEIYEDQSSTEAIEAREYGDMSCDPVLDAEETASLLHAIDSPRSPSRPSSRRHANITGLDDSSQKPSTPTRVKRYNYSESYIDSIHEGGDSEIRPSASTQYNPSARYSRVYQSSDSDIDSFNDQITPTRLKRHILSEAKSDQGWYGAGNGPILQNPLNYLKSSSYSHSGSHPQSRSCISESPFQRRGDNASGDRAVWPVDLSSQRSSCEGPKTGSFSHESASEESCPPSSSLHLYGANFDQTYNRSPYESLRIQQERFKRAESRRISSGLQFPMSGSQQGYSSDYTSKENTLASGFSSVAPAARPGTLQCPESSKSSYRASSQRQATDAQNNIPSSNGSSSLSAEEKRRIFKEEVNALLKSTVEGPRNTRTQGTAEEATVVSHKVKAPSTDESRASAFASAVAPTHSDASVNTGKQKLQPEEAATTTWHLLERATLDLDKGATANNWPPMPRYMPQNIYQARRFGAWGNSPNTSSFSVDVQQSSGPVSSSKARDVIDRATTLDLKAQASAYIKSQIFSSGCGTQSSIKPALGHVPGSSVKSESKPLKPPPGLSKPASQLTKRPTWYVDSLIQNQARLDESNAWFRRDSRGEETIRAQVALFAQDHSEQLKKRGYSTEDCKSAREMSELMGNALVNLTSYVLGDREQQIGNFADFTPAPSDCSSPSSDKHRTFFELDWCTNGGASLGRESSPSANFGHFARRRTSSATNPYTVLEEDSDIDSMGGAW